MSTVSGDPEALESYCEHSLATLDAWTATVPAYSSTIVRYNVAPSEIAHTIISHRGTLRRAAAAIETTSQRARAFAHALRACDRMIGPYPPGVVGTADVALFEALVDAWVDDPDATRGQAMRAALDALTGSPEALAAEFGDIVDDLDLDPDDVSRLQQQLVRALHDIQQGGYSYPYPTDAEMVEMAWERVRAHEAWETLDPAAVARFAEATAKLERRMDDRAYTADFFEALGADGALAVAEAAAFIGWNDAYAGAGRARSVRAVETISGALATASNRLGERYAKELVTQGLTQEHKDTKPLWFGGSEDYLALNDALPLLFTSGSFSRDFSEVIGQLGIDLLAGKREKGPTIEVERGLGSPFFSGFDHLHTAWQERGTVLIEAAARNPRAAAELLLDDRNAALLTSDRLAWRSTDRVLFDDNVGDWDLLAEPVRSLLLAGTVELARTNPKTATAAAGNVIVHATEAGPGAAADALAPAYGAIAYEYLAHFGLVADGGPAPEPFVPDDGRFTFDDRMRSMQFMAVAMRDEASRDRIVARREALVALTIAGGLEGDDSSPDWRQRVANIDMAVIAGLNGEVLLSAAEAEDAAEAFNSNVDLARDSLLAFLPTNKVPGPIRQLQDRLADDVTERYLHRSTGQVEAAAHQVNLNVANVLGSQRLILAEADLIVSVRAVADGTADARNVKVVDTARKNVGNRYVDSLFAVSRGEDVEVPPLSPQHLSLLARDVDFAFAHDLNTATSGGLPTEPQALFP